MGGFTKNSQFMLMGKREFLPLFITQFLGAFHDNLFKNALVVLIIYHTAQNAGLSETNQKLLTTLAAGTLILPFFLFSALGGQLADKYPKEVVIRWTKLFEIFIALMGCLSLYSNSLYLCFLTLFCLGTQSSLFGPCKYSILPQHLPTHHLIGGNALLNTGTFLAILLGSMAGTILMGKENGAFLVSLVMVFISLVGYWSCLYIPPAPPQKNSISLSLNIFSETGRIVRLALTQSRIITLCLLGKAWFFFIGSIFMAQFANFTKINLGANEQVLTLFLIIFSVGIALGGLFNNTLLKGKISLKFVPLAGLGIFIFSADIYFASLSLMDSNTSTLINLTEFMSDTRHWRIMADVFLVAIAAGVFVIPLSTLIQNQTSLLNRARVMAGSAILDSCFMVVATIVCLILISLNTSIPELFLIFGVATCGIALILRQQFKKLITAAEHQSQ
jgi:acyl-[acyl-carrier-protein]-phospholipid O-acyltransferase/long-chain-fatty-acid--[acyl-carrier-protein] ligase